MSLNSLSGLRHTTSLVTSSGMTTDQNLISEKNGGIGKEKFDFGKEAYSFVCENYWKTYDFFRLCQWLATCLYLKIAWSLICSVQRNSCACYFFPSVWLAINFKFNKGHVFLFVFCFTFLPILVNNFEYVVYESSTKGETIPKVILEKCYYTHVMFTQLSLRPSGNQSY